MGVRKGKRWLSLFLVAVLAVGSILGTGNVKAFAAEVDDETDMDFVDDVVEEERINEDSGEKFRDEKMIDDVSIVVEAEKGVFPKGSTLSVHKLNGEDIQDVNEAIDEIRTDNRNVALSYSYDISVLDADGEEIEPDESKGAVKISFETQTVANENLETDIYHVTEDETDFVAEKLDVIDSDDSSVTVETDGFSVYTVEFTYGKLQYVLAGDLEVLLSEVLEKIGLVGEVTNAVASNSELFVVEQENDGWTVSAKRAFSSGEWLKVTINGVEYQIAVTDDAVVSFAGGDGTEENPYQVSTPEQLDAVRNDLSAHYIQTTDIDLSGYENWAPIGGDTDETAFLGEYDGNDHTIRNLTMTESKAETNGLFGFCADGVVIKNINITNLNFQIASNITRGKMEGYGIKIGGIAGKIKENGVIENCTVKGEVNITSTVDKGEICVGGICGMGCARDSENYSNIEVVMNQSNNEARIGGIVGYGNGREIFNCMNYGNIVGEGSYILYAGGILGEHGSVTQCENRGDITTIVKRNNTGYPGVRPHCAGGIVGASFGIILNSINYGNVNSCVDEGYYPVAGGIAGEIGLYDMGEISGCYSLGKEVGVKIGNIYGDLVGRIAGCSGGYETLQPYNKNYAIVTQTLNGDLLNESECGENTRNGKTIQRYPIEGSEGSGVSDETTITRTSTGVVLNHYYGIEKYQVSLDEAIQKDARAFTESMNSYLKILNEQATKEKNKDTNTSSEYASLAEKLIEEDEKLGVKKHISGVFASESDKTVAYMGYAKFISDLTQDGIVLDKINIKEDKIKTSAKKIQEIMDSIGSVSFQEVFNGRRVFVNVFYDGDAFTGSIRVGNNMSVAVNSNINDVMTVMTQYVNDLSDIGKDVTKQGMKELISYFAKNSTIESIIVDDTIEPMLKSYISEFQKAGFGDVLRYILKCKQAYAAVKSLTNISVTSLSDAGDALLELKKINLYSEEDVTNAAVEKAMDKVSDAQDVLMEELFNYVYGEGSSYEPKSLWERIRLGISKNSIKKMLWIECPVDFTLYNNRDDAVIGYVKDGDVYYNEEEVLIERIGDEKFVYFTKDIDFRIDFVATDDGVMNYVIEDTREDKLNGRINYYDIPLKEGKTYSQNIVDEALAQEKDSFVLLSGEGNEIRPSEYISVEDDAKVTIDISCTGGGFATGNGDYVKGDAVILSACPNDGYRFIGWYDGDAIVEYTTSYSFTAMGNRSLEARFVKRDVASTDDDSDYYTNIEIQPDSLALEKGETIEVIADVLPEGKAKDGLLWTSSDTSVVIVREGAVYAVSEGTATISAVSMYNLDVFATCEITVGNGEEVSQGNKYTLPTDLKWDNTKGGWITFKVNDASEDAFWYVDVDNMDSNKIINTSLGFVGKENGLGELQEPREICSLFEESGRYRFRVGMATYGVFSDEKYTDWSDIYTYDADKDKLNPPKNAAWSTKNQSVATWTSNTTDWDYDLELLQDGNLFFRSEACQPFDLSWVITDFDQYKYQFKVRAVSKDLNKHASSDWATFSEVLTAVAKTNDIATAIEEAAAKGEKNIIINKYSSEQNELRAAVQGSTEIQENIRALEHKYAENKNITVNEPKSSDERIDASKVEVIGAGLAAKEGAAIGLNITKDDGSNAKYDANLYNNVYSFNMELTQKDGTQETGITKLDIPITITLPILADMDTATLRILHFLNDGSVETITPVILDGTRAKFTIAHFSRFAFANTTNANSGDTQTVIAKDKTVSAVSGLSVGAGSISASGNRSSAGASGSSSSGSGGGSSSGSGASYSMGDARTAGKGKTKGDYVRIGKESVRFDSSLAGAKAIEVIIPATVKIKGKVYKVTSISSGAFGGMKSLRAIKLGKNIKKINKSAFSGCKKLKTITINSKKLTAKSVKGAFKGSAIKTVIVPADKVEDYKTIFTKKNTGSSSEITVKAKAKKK